MAFLPRASRQHPSTLRNGHQRQAKGAGLSIAQLLIYAAASGFTLAATASTLISNIRSNANLELYQRAQERWGRLSNLIQTETTEAEAVQYSQAVSCPGVNASSIFTLIVPYIPAGNQANQLILPTISIHYYKTGTGSNAELRRCGPTYTADGSLNFSGTAQDSRLATQTDLTLSSNASERTAENFLFNLAVYGPNGNAILGRSARAAVGVSGLVPD